MPSDLREFLKEVAGGRSLTARQREIAEDYFDEYLEQRDGAGREEIVRQVQVRLWRESSTDEVIAVKEPSDGKGAVDERWRLLRELHEAAGTEPYPPLALDGTAGYISLSAPFDSHGRVTLSFDSRLSKAAVIRELTAAWPTLRALGWVRKTRPLGERKLALIRFVCLETPGEPWPERFKLWNERYPEGHEWHERELSTFIATFRSGEKSLTGATYGLEMFYNAGVRWLSQQDDNRDVIAALERGEVTDKEALRFLKAAVARSSGRWGLSDLKRKTEEIEPV